MKPLNVNTNSLLAVKGQNTCNLYLSLIFRNTLKYEYKENVLTESGIQGMHLENIQNRSEIY
jgi:hypothetical protein